MGIFDKLFGKKKALFTTILIATANSVLATTSTETADMTAGNGSAMKWIIIAVLVIAGYLLIRFVVRFVKQLNQHCEAKFNRDITEQYIAKIVESSTKEVEKIVASMMDSAIHKKKEGDIESARFYIKNCLLGLLARGDAEMTANTMAVACEAGFTEEVMSVLNKTVMPKISEKARNHN